MIDHTGERFGRLVVQKMLPRYNGKYTYAECVCDCGNTTIANMSNIRRGATKSCGCLETESRYNRNHAKYKPGDRFGNLTLVKDSGKRSTNSVIIWECKCDCGNIIEVDTNALTKCYWTSCGCSDNITRHHKWDLANKRFKNLTVIEKDNEMTEKKNRTYWLCRCDCGNITSVPQSNLLNGWSGSCGCQRALGAMAKNIANMLNEANIEYIQEYRFDDCKDKLRLPFDYYLPKLNIAIEYDGIQHFKPVNLFGDEQDFLLLKKHDKIKSDYCRNNNIELIRIPYTKTEEEIKTIINKLRTRNE